jgi:uncharacterized membrane protein YgaE (UPF0421/DUF939 family)
MASKRDLKKSIKYLTFEVISDSYTFIYLHPDKKKDDAENIIKDMIKLQNELIYRVNHIEAKESKEIKKETSKIFEDLLEKVDEAFKKLSSLSK